MLRIKLVMIAAVMSLGLTGCSPPLDPHKTDRAKLRIALTQKCIDTFAPDGPRSKTYNDWAEVIQQCDTNALFQSQQCWDNPRACLDMVQGKQE